MRIVSISRHNSAIFKIYVSNLGLIIFYNNISKQDHNHNYFIKISFLYNLKYKGANQSIAT
jgi:hypothetical protein